VAPWWLGGCQPLFTVNLPADLSYVVSNAEAFRADYPFPEQDQAGAEPPATSDPPPEVESCFGAYAEACSVPEITCIRIWQVLHFKPRTNELIRYTAEDLFGVLRVADVWHGTYSVMEDGHLKFRVRRVESNVPGGSSFTDITHKYQTLPVYDLYLEGGGDQIAVRLMMPADDPRAPAGFVDTGNWFVHRSFDCPD